MNKVFLSGNLTRDPEIKYTPNGKAMARMGIAVNRRFKNQETGQYDVDFFNLVAWEKTAEFCGRYFRKGSRVLVEGTLRTYSYTGQDGNKRSGIDIWVDNVEFGNSKRDEGGNDYDDGRMEQPRTPTTPTRPAPEPKPTPEPELETFEDLDDEFVVEEISDDKLPF